MSWSFSAVFTKPVLFRISADPKSALENAVRKAMDIEQRQQIKLFRQTTAYWRHKPDFEYKIETMGDVMTLTVYTDDKIYGYINYGTRVRYATMSKDFQSKTNPGSLRSGRGKNPDPVYVSKKVPRAGIQARDFTGQIFDQRMPIFSRRINRAMIAEIKRITGFK